MPAVIPSVVGERLDDLDGRRRHDVRAAPGLAMEVEQPASLGADLVEQLGQDLGVEGDESSWRIPATAPRTRSRTPSVFLSLPRELEHTADPTSRTNWPVRSSPAARRRAPTMKADDPAISVRSRSKNAALGPLPTIRRYPSSACSRVGHDLVRFVEGRFEDVGRRLALITGLYAGGGYPGLGPPSRVVPGAARGSAIARS